MSTHKYEVEFRQSYTDRAPVITGFNDQQATLAYAQQCLVGPYYMLRIHDTETSEWLTYAQFAHRVEGEK